MTLSCTVNPSQLSLQKKACRYIRGQGKNPWVHHPFHDVDVFLIYENREENGYPPRSHDCQPEETEFAQAFEEAQEDLERREKNANHKRTMHMWKNVLEHVWNTRPIEHTQKLIDRMPKVMEAIIEAEGGKRNIEFSIQFKIPFNNGNIRTF